jgi:hypothetical protein
LKELNARGLERPGFLHRNVPILKLVSVGGYGTECSLGEDSLPFSSKEKRLSSHTIWVVRE